jgi:CDGSH-type Zn-finger protein/truncated hemoglobin YjbI
VQASQWKAGMSEVTDVLATARRLERQARSLAAPGLSSAQRFTAAADRLARSVIRPLQDAEGRDPGGRGAARAGDAAHPLPTGPSGVAAWEQELWSLARETTQLRCCDGRPSGLLEATAGLQDLVRGIGADQESRHRRLQELADLQADVEPEIRAAHDGPYLVTNPRRLESWLGAPVETTPQMALCRCGHSNLKPLCDGSHREVGFSGAKDPARVPDRRDTYVGQQVTVLDNRGICQHSGLCTDRLATVFRLGQEPFVAPSGGRMDEIIRAVRDCPSGALSYAVDGVEARADVDHHDRREPTIQVTRDGPYRVSGGVALRADDGREVQPGRGGSREHYALCRCGQSENKPFCSGMHWYVSFQDPIRDPERIPTMFEWCGGLPALTRMTRLFYEKHVPQDSMLAPLFANMSADHPQRVAKWLAEVFGGPPSYSEDHGGYPRMLSQHVGKGLTEDWRARWVTLLLRSAREAGLPNDPEFRSAFQAYIEWGSRLAVENSQSDAAPPERMPMPRWDWGTAAGPPGSRASAPAPASEKPEEAVVLPAGDGPIRYEEHIRQLFRERDRRSMSFAFDLWSYEDVRRHADEILERVRNGSMPCDRAWPQEWVDVFARWVEAGTAA